MRIGDLFFGRRIRQNHALEHATVTILATMIPNLRVSARSSGQGFIIFGDVDRGKVRAAAQMALERLQAGEAELAIHPNCGTNLAVGMVLAVIGGLLVMSLGRSRLRVIPAVAGALLAGSLGRPLGQVVQRHVTTLPDLHGVRVTEVMRRKFLRFVVVDVQTVQD
ncbi:MAG TPA: DUF6391 domain-containing protein [Ktedonobacterales bacterium]